MHTQSTHSCFSFQLQILSTRIKSVLYEPNYWAGNYKLSKSNFGDESLLRIASHFPDEFNSFSYRELMEVVDL